MGHSNVRITIIHTLFLGCALFIGGYGLQTYSVNVTTNDGRLTALPACVTTQPGRKSIKTSDTPPSYTTCVYIDRTTTAICGSPE